MAPNTIRLNNGEVYLLSNAEAYPLALPHQECYRLWSLPHVKCYRPMAPHQV